MHADHISRTRRLFSQHINAQARSGRRQNRAGLTHPIQGAEEFLLRFQILNDCLNNDVDAADTMPTPEGVEVRQ